MTKERAPFEVRIWAEAQGDQGGSSVSHAWQRMRRPFFQHAWAGRQGGSPRRGGCYSRSLTRGEARPSGRVFVLELGAVGGRNGSRLFVSLWVIRLKALG